MITLMEIMRYLERAFLLLSITICCAILNIGCVTNPSAEPDSKATTSHEADSPTTPEIIESEPTTPEIIESEPAASRNVEPTVESELTQPTFRLKSERQLRASHELEKIITYAYVGENLLSLATTTDSNEKILSTIEFLYDGLNPIRQIKRDGQNQLTSMHDYTYDQEGRVTSDIYSDSRGKVQSLIRYDYDKTGKLAKVSVYSGNDELIAYERHEYENGGLARKKTFDKNNNLLHSTAYEHDSAGNITLERGYLQNGQLEKETNYIYNANGSLIEIRITNDQGKILSKQLHDYTEYGYLNSIIYYSSHTMIDRHVLYTYERGE